MASFRRTKAPAPEPVTQPTGRQSLTASAARMRMDGQGFSTWRFGDDAWQQEAWRLYDVIGELRFIANWIGAACSRVRIYVAEVDENGRIQQEVTNKKIAGLADSLFGGPSGRSEAMRLLGINLTIAGDVYVVGREDGDSETWMVVSCSELKRWGPSGDPRVAWILDSNDPRTKLMLNPQDDLIIRIWTPHPRRGLWADSPTRGAMPMLYEIERLTRYVFAQIDSRLISAGLLPIPQEASFPDEDPSLSPSEALTDILIRVGSESLKGEGTAAGVVPTVMEVPLEALGKIGLVAFASDLSKQAQDLRTEALRRLALSMDIDPSILAGMGDANHWGAWQILEGQIKIHVEPLMTRICDGLTTAYLQPNLKSMKGVDPSRYIYWYDTAPLSVRPERLKDTLQLYSDGLVSKKAVLLSGDYKISDAPDTQEELQKFTRDLLLRNPNLFSNPAVRKVAGYTEEILPSSTVIDAGGGGAGPPPPPPPPTGITDTPGAALPQDSTAQNALPGPGGDAGVPSGTPTGVTAASTSVPVAMNVFMIANATVLRALDRAGKRMLTRQTVGQFPEVPTHELHTKLPRREDPAYVMSLLDGSWDQMSALAEMVSTEVDLSKLQQALQGYCYALIQHRAPHSPQLMGDWLKQRGLLDGDT